MDERTEAMFEEVSGKVEVDEATAKEAHAVLQRIMQLGVQPDTWKQGPWVWIVCAIFVAGFNKRKQTGSSKGKGKGPAPAVVKLPALLQAAGIRVSEFLDHLQLLTQRLELGDAIAQAAANLKMDYMNTSSVFAKYGQLWKCRDRLSQGGGKLEDTDPIARDVFALGWALFINCKSNFKDADKPNDLVASFHMMLACLEFIVRHSRGAAQGAEASDNSNGNGDADGDKKPEAAPRKAEGRRKKSPAKPRAGADAGDQDDDEEEQRPKAPTSMESMEEDAIAALSMMSANMGKRSGKALLAKASKVQQDVLEDDAAKVLTYVRDLLKAGVLKSKSPINPATIKETTDLAGLFMQSVIAENLAGLQGEYESKVVNAVDALDERFVLAPPAAEDTSAQPSGAQTPSKAATSRPSVFTPRTSGRTLFQDVAELTRASSQQAAPFSPLPSTAAAATPQKPQRPSMQGGLSTPIRSPRGVAFGHYQSPVAQTPVLAATEAVNWLNSIENLPSTPSAKLEEYAALAQTEDFDPMAAIQGTVITLLERLTLTADAPGLSEEAKQAIAQARRGMMSSREDQVARTRRLGLALYYKVLLTMLDKESERLRVKDHGSLFRHEPFHRALLACCIEVVLKAQSLVTLAFPKILDLFEVQAYNFYKVLESFVKASPGLPYLLRQHLHELEEQVMERVAWAKAQPGVAAGEEPALFRLIADTKANGLWPVPSLRDKAPGQPQPAWGQPGQKPPMSLEFFFRKVLYLGAQRVRGLCLRLEVGNDNMDKIWTAFKFTVRQHVEMLYGRHLDHILLCSVYAICKVNKVEPEVTFKRIIDAYRRPGSTANAAQLSVIRDIELPSGRRGDIIKFYNEAYIPVLKTYILQFQQGKTTQEPAPQDNSNPPSSPPPSSATQPRPADSPVITPLPIQSPMRSPQRIRSSNVYLSTTASPARHPVTGALLREHMTPRTGVLYAFGESPKADLESINKAVNKRPRPAAAPSVGPPGIAPAFSGPFAGRSHKKLKMG